LLVGRLPINKLDKLLFVPEMPQSSLKRNLAEILQVVSLRPSMIFLQNLQGVWIVKLPQSPNSVISVLHIARIASHHGDQGFDTLAGKMSPCCLTVGSHSRTDQLLRHMDVPCHYHVFCLECVPSVIHQL
jgi:hypothetical protein